MVALTFDDGPWGNTSQILSVLGAFHAHATFFVIGRQVAQYAAIVRAEVSAGDEVGNHTYSHADLAYLSNSSIKLQLQQTQNAVRAVAGVTPVWFHPPDGVIDSRIAAVTVSLGLRPLLWSVDPKDWSRPGARVIAQRVLMAVRPGSIVLLHDGGGDRSQTVAALSIILRALQSEGYRFVTVSDLFHLPRLVSCDEASADRWFAAARVAPIAGHAIYRAWFQAYCAGTNYGPSTNGEYSLSSAVVAQDFARTAHRLEWDRISGSIHVTLMWPWATQVFTARGIRPRWHTPITHAWFDQFFRGYNWGPALQEPQVQNGVQTQCFLRACAVNQAGQVTWKS